MKMNTKVQAIIVGILVFNLLTPTFAFARSGCCSHHGGVCGCGCCDGTGLSSTCAPYYPECSGGAVEEQPVYVPPVIPTHIPTIAVLPTRIPPTRVPPTHIPTQKPTRQPTPTQKPTPTVTPSLIPTATITEIPTSVPTSIPTTEEKKVAIPTVKTTRSFWSRLFSLFFKTNI